MAREPSLSRRLILGAALWITLALAVAGVGLAALFRQHVEAMVAARDEAQAHSGERKGYLANLICEADELAERWDIVKTLGVDGVLMSPVLQGFSTLSMLARERQMPILAHNTFSDLLTRHPVGHRASGAERPVRKPRRRLDRDLGRIRCWRWRRRC